jgi:hypothetical protein
LSIVLPQQHVGPEDPSIPHDLRDLVAFAHVRTSVRAASFRTRTNPVRTVST